ncbi:hypothetical protein NG798_25765 [Ancylothrix sp. C2]|uniref:hypothetical protein n=1 Tax=Ancylothrix sp. D3o TaxID=2953691 RepID=UPI0021BAD1CF|nr:hypothetical protein [Ancylothrix sp. D3o]MCT7953209.1 hypothetical protein [Ancylothrix sp. D3o]
MQLILTGDERVHRQHLPLKIPHRWQINRLYYIQGGRSGSRYWGSWWYGGYDIGRCRQEAR